MLPKDLNGNEWEKAATADLKVALTGNEVILTDIEIKQEIIYDPDE